MNSVEILKEINKLTARMHKQQSKYLDKINELKKICPHDALIDKSFYSDGSYYDKAYTNYWQECVGCGKKMNERHETHSWYG